MGDFVGHPFRGNQYVKDRIGAELEHVSSALDLHADLFERADVVGSFARQGADSRGPGTSDIDLMVTPRRGADRMEAWDALAKVERDYKKAFPGGRPLHPNLEPVIGDVKSVHVWTGLPKKVTHG